MRPRIRRRQRAEPPYPLDHFPPNFAHAVGKQIIYILATKEHASLEGPEWEEMFANAIEGDWKPSPVGLDDILKGNCAWGAKSVKSNSPFTVATIRLISGRNNPEYSFGYIESDDNGIGKQVLEIWNARVDEIRSKYAHARTVTLIKGVNWIEYSVFETETLRYQPELYEWRRNPRNNLEGFETSTGKHGFTWQRHGSQFTIIEDVPPDRLKFRVRIPPAPSVDQFLGALGYDPSWVEVVP